MAVTLDEAERDKLLDQVERQFMAKDLPSIPLYARPIYVIRANGVQGPRRQPDARGKPLEREHVEDCRLGSSLHPRQERPPLPGGPSLPGDDAARRFVSYTWSVASASPSSSSSGS